MSLNDIPSAVRTAIADQFHLSLSQFSFCGGGCINRGGKLQTSAGNFFLKWNDARKFPGMFEAEAKGLRLLATHTAIDIPEVIANGQADAFQFLLLEFIDERPRSPDYWKIFGRQLASLHKHTAPSFGLDHHNYIGSLTQQNTPTANWVEFFIEQRLTPQLRMAIDHRQLSTKTANQFEQLFGKLPGLLPTEQASLLHGDLWSGNVITNEHGSPCLIDPAVYYGHREAELAFTLLFGGFSSAFYSAYHESHPLETGWRERVDIYNLYPLLVHVNLFGGSYMQQVVSIVEHFV